MSFDYSTLITDRAEADADALRTLVKKPLSQWTAAEAETFTAATLKGSYDYTDLNRVSACMEDLVARLNWLGYNVPGYARVEIAHTGGSRLPDGYTEVAYIQSSGTQYVDTGFRPNQDTKVEMDVVPLSIAEAGGSSGFIPYGAATSYNSNAFECYTTASKLSFNYDGQYKVDGTISVGVEIHIDHNENNVVVTSSGTTVVESNFAYNAFNVPYSLTLCGSHRASMLCGHQQIKNCQIYDNGVLIRDYVPCINADNAVGLYDLVNGQFYGNSGTGTFAAGNVVESASDSDALDPYTWYVSDAPTESQLARYRANVAAVRSVLALPTGTEQVPDNILTVTEANAIEAVLLAIDQILSNMPAARRHSGVTICGVKGVIA